MQNPNSLSGRKTAAGFALPSVLVVVGALLILAVGILLVVGVERSTARSFVDRERAELAARAGLEEVKGILGQDAANDDFLVIQSKLAAPIEEEADPAPHLFIARGSDNGDKPSYRYQPLFSRPRAAEPIPDSSTVATPELERFVPVTGSESNSKTSEYTSFLTLPYQDKVQAAWLPVTDSKGRMIARYAYWVEDLQSRLDARTAGNVEDGGNHKRYGWKAGDAAKIVSSPNPKLMFPAPGLNPEESQIGMDGRDAEPPLNQVALYALDPASDATDKSTLDNTIIDGRASLISPGSVLAVAGVVPPLTRAAGHLVDPKAMAVEVNLTAVVQPYDEQPLVPFATGIDASVTGEPKRNLNALLAMPPGDAVDDMAAWIKKGLPEFDSRKGGFPDNYLKTLAANAIDYSDTDKDGTTSGSSIMGADAYRGIDAYPLMSEVILHVKYNGTSVTKGRRVLLWDMIVFIELWNHTNQNVEGQARVSYENGMIKPAIGTGIAGVRFDSPTLMDSSQVTSQPQLEKIGTRYYSAPRSVSLKPNQYKFYKAALVQYKMDVGSSSTTLQSAFSVVEDLGSSGISLMWNDREVDRSDKLVRGNTSATDPQTDYRTSTPTQFGKANIPGHSYGPYNNKKPFPDYRNNMGDSRQALYLRGSTYPVSDNSYPGNVSPNRRNIRNVSIYKNTKGQDKVFGRVMPSEWPDGGHDAPVSGLAPPDVYLSDNDYDPTDLLKFPDYVSPNEGDAPTFVSNRGRFYSATELGRIFDPIMFSPKYDKATDTATILTGNMPSGRVSWPSVEVGSAADIYFGGGNTLRIGRPEHPNFDRPANHAPIDMPGTHAARLLDLFHAGKSRSQDAADREGPLVRIEGHVNLNTATEDAVRAICSGEIVMDPRLLKRTSEIHSTTTFAPPVSPLAVSTPTKSKQADLVAQAILRSRPFASPSEVASILNEDGKLLLGNRDLLPDGNKIQWSDAAAEELFGRIHESSTVRSRNFRVWVIGQSIAPTQISNSSPEVLSEVRKAFTVFSDPGVRNSDGSINTSNFHTKVINENDF